MTTQEFKQKWITALRSGEYKQNNDALLRKNNEFCCLGVACDIAVKNNIPLNVKQNSLNEFSYNGEKAYLPKIVQETLGLKTSNGEFTTPELNETTDLALLNDKGNTFPQIADIIEQNPQLFNE